MRTRTALFAVIAMLTAVFAATGTGMAQSDEETADRERPPRLSGITSEDFSPQDLDEAVQVFIQLDEPSVSEAAASQDASVAAQRSQGQTVLAQQDRVAAEIDDLIVEEQSRLQVGANGIRAMVRVRDIPAIRATDGVKSVAPVTHHYPTNETSVPWIGGTATQDLGYTGEGISIAIIDTGIDYTHASFGGDEDYEGNDPGVVEPGTFPTDKVVGGFDFAGPTYDASQPALDTPSPDADPLDVNGHGTHVAATAAGLEIEGVGGGMAPDADLYAFKVFGDVTGSTALVSDAIERALDPNNDLSIDDAVDVINMSLGSDFGNPGDPSAIAAQNAMDLGVVVVAASGNAGTAPYVTGSPAVADSVISVAASVDDGVEVLAIEVLFPDESEEQMEAQPGDFGPLDPGVTGDLAVAQPLDGCSPITNDVDGAIALVQRGTCEFTVKVRNAENAGAIGVVLFNDVPEPPIAPGHNGTDPKPDIPTVMVSLADGQRLAQATGQGTVTVTLSDEITIPKPELADTMAGFTSRGPGFGNVFKPDLSAPGFSIFSAEVGSGNEGSLGSGTSMATPHVAGAVAQILDWDSDLEPHEVKALLMNSASPANVAADPAGEFVPGEVPVSAQGTGIIHVDKVVDDLGGYATPGGVTFYFNPTESTGDSASVEVTRLDSANDATYDVEFRANQTLSGVTWDVPATVSTSGGTGSFDIDVTVDPTQLDSDTALYSQTESDGWVVLTNTENGDDSMVVGVVAVADPASTVTAAGGESVVAISNEGPGGGFADGFTLVETGADSPGDVGFRTGFVSESDDPDFGPYDTIEFGVALSSVWQSPSSLELNLFIDVDQDGTDDFVLVAADLGFLQGATAAGQVATALFDLSDNTGVLLYIAPADFNDRVLVLPADLTGDFGFLAEGSDAFDITLAAFNPLGLVGVSDTVTVDLGTEVEGDLSLAVPAGAATEVTVDGQGDMLWLFPNNAAAGQHAKISVSSPEGEPDDDQDGEDPTDPEPPPSFTDVAENHLFNNEIIWLAQQDITRGCNPPANTMFCPDDPVTRGQMAAFLNRALDLAATDTDFFVDDGNSVFEGDINRLAAADITRGCNPPANSEFCPLDDLTRAQMASFMVRGFGFADGAGDDLFVDDDFSVHEMDIDIIGTAGVTRGCNPPANDQFCPVDEMTRGQMAAFIFRAFQAAGLAD